MQWKSHTDPACVNVEGSGQVCYFRLPSPLHTALTPAPAVGNASEEELTSFYFHNFSHFIFEAVYH